MKERRFRMVFPVVVIILALVLMTGCEEYATYTSSAAGLTALAEEYHGEDKEMIQGTAVARFSTAEAARGAQTEAQAAIVQAEATRQAAEAEERRQYLMMTADAEGTARAVRATLEQQWQWATIESANATQVAQATAQAFAMQMTSTAAAMEATATERAYRATATAEALSQAATATAQHQANVATATAWAGAVYATATRGAWAGAQTATAESRQATAQVAHATMTRQAERREEVLGYGRDYGIPLVLLIVAGGIGALVVYGLRQYARRPIVYPRSALGDAEPMACPVRGGGYTFIDLDRQPGPALTALPDGTVSAPQLRSAAQEERTTARDQLVDAMNRPKLGAGTKRGIPIALPTAPPVAEPPIRVLPPEQVRPWIEDVETQLLEEVNE